MCNKFMPVSSMLLGIDIVPIKPMRNVTLIQADITQPQCKTLIKQQLQGWDVDLVLHDGAPNVAGGQVWSRDAYQQNELVVYALRLATYFLKPQGMFITKVFRSQDYNSLLWVLKQLFGRVDSTKPLASRAASAEIFLVCREYKAPKSIDPAMLDPTHLFQHFEQQQQHTQIFSKQHLKAARSRGGYDEQSVAAGILGKTTEIMTFIESEDPIVELGSYHSFTFTSPTGVLLLSHSSTTTEVRSLCEDLKVLGKGDFKALLKWRKKIREFIKSVKQEQLLQQSNIDNADAAPVTDPSKKPVELLSESELAAIEESEMTVAIAALKDKQQRMKKLEKKKKHERKQKQQRRLLFNKNNLADAHELVAADENDELFQLAAVKGVGAMDLLQQMSEEVLVEDEEEAEHATEHPSDDDALSDDEQSYYRQLERDLDSLYDQYRERRKISDRPSPPTTNSSAIFNGQTQSEMQDDDELPGQDESQPLAGQKRPRQDSDDSTSEEEEDAEVEAEEAEEQNPLLVSLADAESTKLNADVRVQRWFQRDVFHESQMQDRDIDEAETESTELSAAHAKQPRGSQLSLVDMMNAAGNSDTSDSSDSDLDDDSDEDGGRWLGEGEDGVGESDDAAGSLLSSTSSLPPSQRLLVGLASLSKSRQQLALEKQQTEADQKNLSKNREQADKGVDAAEDAADEDEDDAHLLVDLDSKKKAKKLQKRSDKKHGIDRGTAGGDESGFEEVAAEAPREVYSDDDEAVATTLALGHRSLLKRHREDLVNGSYNRYSVDLSLNASLPGWFLNEEKLHNTATLPVTKAEVEEYKDRLRLINDRPIKKIAEAKMRNKLKTERKWERIKQKLHEVENNPAMSNSSEKLKLMERVISRRDKRGKKKVERKYIISKRGGGTVGGGKDQGRGKQPIVRVDPRQKKDKRGMAKAEKRNTQKKKTANKRRRKV